MRHVACGAQVDAGVDATVLAAQPFSVEQVGAREFGAESGAAEAVYRFAVQILGGVRFGDQRPGARLHAQAEVGSAGPGEFRQMFGRVGGEANVSAARGGLDQLGQRPHRDVQRVGVPSPARAAASASW